MNCLNIVTVVGARPQFIKAAPVNRALRLAGHNEFIVHTGQHYDYEMSQVFFEDLAIPEPNVNLGIGSGSHGFQTAQMLIGIEEIIQRRKPDWVVVYGDTNSTLAGALAAAKLHIRIAHVEAGLRSYNKRMPEEVNRILTDHVSGLLFCPSAEAVRILRREGIESGVHLVGDVMYDSIKYNLQRAEKCSCILESLRLRDGEYVLVTIHRAENTDVRERIDSIFVALRAIAEEGIEVVLPLHPRTRNRLQSFGIDTGGLKTLEPVSYLDMLVLEKYARVIVTDSGGVQKEAYWFGVPCVTVRDETEWVETVDSGWNVLAGCDVDVIVGSVRERRVPDANRVAYGDGSAALKIAGLLSL